MTNTARTDLAAPAEPVAEGFGANGLLPGNAANSRTSSLTMLLLSGLTLLVGWMQADDTPMTSDEAITFAIVDRSFGGFLSVLRTEGVAMAPYHIGLWIWTQFGESDSWVRMFSVLGGVATVCLLFALANRWLGYRAAIAACVIMITNPFFHRYLTDARTYSWLMAIGLVMVLATDNLLRRHRRSDGVWLGLAVGLGIASHVTFVAVIGSLAIAIALAGKIDLTLIRRLTLPAGIAVVAVLPVAYLVLTRRSELAQNAPATPFRFAAVTSTSYGSTPTSPILLLGIGVLLAALVLRRLRTWPALGLAAMAVGPPILLAAISIVTDDVYNSRYLSPLIPFASAAAVAGYRFLWPARRDTLVPAGLVLVCFAAGMFGPTVDDARSADPIAAARFLTENVSPGDVVLFEPDYTRVYLARYWGYHPEVDPTLIGWDDSDLRPPRRPLDDVRDRVDAAQTVWLVTLEGDSEVLEQVRGERDLTSHTFRRLRVIELTSPET